ncbi:hypothetical protein PIB30_062125 [Stylosanthes scabra]|uniref:Early nodulin-75-like n=1 Tax=Stylosanthes scabra TaxID=79078 RepID=A0ABU6XLZ9_9FABA|nr:hypothetical protein [Stylosanthes scabra]
MDPRYILVLLLALTFAVANSLARSPTFDNYPNSHSQPHKRHHPPLEEEENTEVNNYPGGNKQWKHPTPPKENPGMNGNPKGKHPPNEEEKHDEVDSYHPQPKPPLGSPHKPPHLPPNNNPVSDGQSYKPPHKGHPPPRQGDNSQEDTYVKKKPPHGGHGDHHPEEVVASQENTTYGRHKPPHTPNHIN